MKRQLHANSDFRILPLLTYKAAEKIKLSLVICQLIPRLHLGCVVCEHIYESRGWHSHMLCTPIIVRGQSLDRNVYYCNALI